jgi:hypothetical protein
MFDWQARVGGGVYIINPSVTSTLTISSTLFSNNSATGRAGALDIATLQQVPATLTNVTFTNNRVSGRQGGSM